MSLQPDILPTLFVEGPLCALLHLRMALEGDVKDARVE